MPTILTTKAERGSSYVINVQPKDEDDVAVVCDSVEYDVTDQDGNVVNSQSAVSVTPATSMDIMLSGADLDFLTAEEGAVEVIRFVTFRCVYDSSLELNVALVDTAIFKIVDPNQLGS